MNHKKFNYRHINELKEDILCSGIDVPVSERLDVLKESLPLNGKLLPNRLLIHPMEGCDGTGNGAPGELTFRRYKRFGLSGAGLIWVEACGINNEARANPRQLYLDRNNLPEFKKLFDEMISSAKAASGEGFRPYTVLQLTHPGRYSKPYPEFPAIVAVEENPFLDNFSNPKRRIIPDKELELLENQYIETAHLAKETGFDAVDIKSCHGYLISELLSAHTRKGRYGGSFENRTRFLLNIIDKLKASVDIDVTVRINAYDAIPYPYGWGTDENGQPSLDEPCRLMRILREKGVKIVNITTGNPYYNPHIGRPADIGPYVAHEHPVESAGRMLNIIREIKSAVPEMVIAGTGLSWFREYGANIAAGCIEKGWFDIAGFGRQSLAYPDFAKDIINEGGMLRNKCCITCTKCTEIMRFGGQSGCVIRDNDVYLPVWKGVTQGCSMMGERIGEHI